MIPPNRFFNLFCFHMLKIRTFLGAEIDNSGLILFRMLFGFLIFIESIGAILVGWVDKTFIAPRFTFSFIPLFDWYQPLPAAGMYAWFVIMGILGLSIMLGYRYQLSTLLYLFAWSGIYLMQKTHYNNHHYLWIILTFTLFLLPAHRDRSLDVRWGRVKQRRTCKRIHVWVFISLVGLIYLVASMNKLHPDWMQAKPIAEWFDGKINYPVIGPLLGKDWFRMFIAWGGIFYDGLIFFILLYPRTRLLGFILSIIFNLMNSIIFQIGVFPYVMIALSLLFFQGETLRKKIFRDQSPAPETQPGLLPNRIFVPYAIFLVIMALLPLRHHLYEGDVHWTEEGHRLSWQMMLRSKRTHARVHVVDKNTGIKEEITLPDFLSRSQRARLAGRPDFAWQFARYLKKHFKKEGKDVEVYIHGLVSLNGSLYAYLLNPKVDLAAVPWEPFKHSEWILDENRP